LIYDFVLQMEMEMEMEMVRVRVRVMERGKRGRRI
jgi:hypothetical protein